MNPLEKLFSGIYNLTINASSGELKKMEQEISEITAKSKRRFRLLIPVFIIGAIFFKMSFIFLFFGMLPSMAAYVVDHDKRKYVCSTVAALNFAGVFPFMMDIFKQGGSFDTVKAILSDPIIWFIVYGSAGLGWTLIWISPIIAALALDGIYRGRIIHLEIVQKHLEEEWGEEVAGKVKSL